ncbi:unnamed protein product [Darwinula stevensoni]|uniref:Uncharacterized protein n=1 Tax=Darwinula stevensoni TaxID=69355 RepID=A0A7R9A8D5_9CRUS|nr:unnamed protein product [Darwinula stevensoni]CAG0896265.1 unnamed protein product [Darwinula stevensoni]
MRFSNWLLLGFAIAFLSYLCIGALIFGLVESPAEHKIEEELLEKKQLFLNLHPCVTEDALEELIELIEKANNRGVSASRNFTREPNWSFGQAFFFSGTVVTTIGRKFV